MKYLHLVILLLLSSQSFGQIKDTIYFLNNSILVGKLKKINLGKIEFDGDGIGIVNIKYDKVKTIKANSHLYRIETTAKKILNGTIENAANAGRVLLITDTGNVEIKLSNITTLSYYGQNWKLSLWGSLGAGYSYTKSSNIGRLNFNGRLKYVNRKTELELTANTIITTDSTGTYRERENMELSDNYLINYNFYAGVFLRYQRSIELGLLRRWQEGSGLGYNFIQRKHSIGKSITGLVINQETNFDHQQNNSLEWVAQGSYAFFSFSKPNISLSTSQTIYTSFTQKGRIRYDGDVKINWEPITDFGLEFNYYYNSLALRC